MRNPTIREFLYPMRNLRDGIKTPLKIIVQEFDRTQVLYECNDAAGEFKMKGQLLEKHIGNWYIQDGTLVIDIGGCPHRGIGRDGDKCVKYCSCLGDRKIIDGQVAILYSACSFETCPLMLGKNGEI